MRIGVERSRARSDRQTAIPSFPGRSQSSTITSYSFTEACSSPTSPVGATSTTNPSSWSPLARSLAALRSSSISRTRIATYRSEPRDLRHNLNKNSCDPSAVQPRFMQSSGSTHYGCPELVAWTRKEDRLMEPRLMPPVSRRHLLKLGSTVAAASALGLRHGESLADGDPPPANVKQPDRGGAFRIRIAQSPAHFDPHQTAAYSTMVPLSFAYSRLVMIKPGSSIVTV